MRKPTIILSLGALVLAAVVGCQVAACELASIELQDDMQDLASQLGTRIGVSALSGDEELRQAVIRKAEAHHIQLEPSQVTVEHIGFGYTSTVYLAADYKELIHLPGVSFALHFTPATDKKLLVWRTQ